jgi:tRNA-specific 2-thiouridylase
MERVMIAMSGGVDSTVAALLIKELGGSCAGGAMRLTGDGVSDSAAASAGALGLPFHLFDCADTFNELVITPFIEEYRSGRTPNPCVECNRVMKFGIFMRMAAGLGFDRIATGHYARAGLENGRYLLKKGIDPVKDQSYFLYTLTQEQLARVIFPLGGMTKDSVRELALKAGLPAAASGESQDICFIPGGGHASFIGGDCLPGRFIDPAGNDLGEHKGIIHYTVGQRRGLGVSGGEPLYVTRICQKTNTVTLGTEALLYGKTLTARRINLCAVGRIDAPLRARVKIRYRHAEQPAAVTQTGEDSLLIEFDEPQRAVTPGQSAVIYDGDTVIGGGVIC